jgi:hypothetical protein
VGGDGVTKIKTGYIEDMDEWLWGAGYEKCRWVGGNSPRISHHFPPLNVEPIQCQVLCAHCGEPVPMDNHFAYGGRPYHALCLPIEAWQGEEATT